MRRLTCAVLLVVAVLASLPDSARANPAALGLAKFLGEYLLSKGPDVTIAASLYRGSLADVFHAEEAWDVGSPGAEFDDQTVALFDEADKPSRWAGTDSGQVREDNGLGMKLVWCPPGSLRMGSPDGEKYRRANEHQVNVTLSRGFWVGMTEVTQGQGAAFVQPSDRCRPRPTAGWLHPKVVVRSANQRGPTRPNNRLIAERSATMVPLGLGGTGARGGICSALGSMSASAPSAGWPHPKVVVRSANQRGPTRPNNRLIAERSATMVRLGLGDAGARGVSSGLRQHVPSGGGCRAGHVIADQKVATATIRVHSEFDTIVLSTTSRQVGNLSYVFAVPCPPSPVPCPLSPVP